MEAPIIAVISLIGSLVSGLLLVDALRDRWLVHNSDPPRVELFETARQRVVGESVRFAIQLMFLYVAFVVAVGTQGMLREVGSWLLFSIPIILAVWSVYVWSKRSAFLWRERRAARREARTRMPPPPK